MLQLFVLQHVTKHSVICLIKKFNIRFEKIAFLCFLVNHKAIVSVFKLTLVELNLEKELNHV